MSTPISEQRSARAGSGASSSRKALTIGAVAKILGQEFDDISISKIRYLEDQKLLSPRRTPGGYRLYSQADVERLRKILELQRDEFLPLRVIRRELAQGSERDEGRARSSAQRRAVSVEHGGGAHLSVEDMVEQTGVTETLLTELEEYRLVQPKQIEGSRFYDETDREIVVAAVELSRWGVSGRHLRVFRTSADREAGLLEQLIGPSLQSHDAARRRDAIESLDTLAASSGHLKHLLLIRDLRKFTGE